MTARAFGGISRAITQVAGGNVSGSYTPTVGSSTETWLTCTLTGDTTFNVTLSADTILKVFATQDGTGGRAVTVSDGAVTLSVPVSTGAGAVSAFTVFSPDGAELVVQGGGAAIPPSVKTTDYTLTSADDTVEVNSSSNRVITIPENAGLQVGDEVTVARTGTGDVTFKAGAGVILNSASGYRKISARHGEAKLFVRAANDWRLSGDIAATTTFAPATDVPNIGLWLDAAQLSLNDGDAISPFTDVSGASHNATQATSANRATYKTGRVNGLPSAKFDGVNDYYAAAALTATDATRTIWIVLAPDTGSPAHRYYAWALTDQGHGIYLESGQWKFGKNEAGTATTIGSASTLDVIACRFNSTSSCDVSLNGGVAVNLNPDDAYQSSGGFSLTIGASANGDVSTVFGGDIPEVIASSDAVTDLVFANASAYLMTRWGKT